MKQKICLNMIVKDEAPVIKRCLESVKPLIDYWVIVDTGSTDNTQEIIRECLKETPGELHEKTWVDFSYNRNEALQLAKDKGDYLLLIDADEILELSSDFTSLKLDKECYLIQVQEGAIQSEIIFLVKASLRWEWYGVVHENLKIDKEVSIDTVQGIKMISRTREGGRSRAGDKYKKDALLLEEALKKEPDNARYHFYLGQCYLNTNEPERALSAFLLRSQMEGDEEERFWSLFQVAVARETLNCSPSLVIDSYISAHRFRPSRAEPLFRLAVFHFRQKNYLLGYIVAKHALSIPMPKDHIFVMPEVYNYGLLMVLADCAYELGKTAEAKEAKSALLLREDLPFECRERLTQWN